MESYLNQLADRVNSQANHAFVLYGATRDKQRGQNGSCSLSEHLMQTMTALDLLVAIYRIGSGWTFALDSARAEFCELVGLGNGNAGEFAGLGVNSQTELPLEPETMIGLVEIGLKQSNRRVAVILDRAELICPATSYDRMSPGDKAVLSILQSLAVNEQIADSGNLLILVTDTLQDIAETVRLASGRFYAIEIVPPDYAERLEIAELVMDKLVGRVSFEMSAQELAASTSMMTRYALQDSLLVAKQAGVLTKQIVRDGKNATMKQEYGDVIELLEPLPNGFSGIAGQERLKQFATDVVANMIAGNYQDVPAGI